MKKLLALLLAALLLFSCAAHAQSLYVFCGSEWNERLHLRTKPDRAAPSLGRYYTGVRVQVLEDMGEWMYVRIASGTTGAQTEGYMMSEFLAAGGPMAGWQPYMTVAASSPLLDASENAVGHAAAGESVFVLADCGRRMHVMTADGVMGYLPADALSGDLKKPADAQRILVEAVAVASGGVPLYAGAAADSPVVATLHGGVILEDRQLLPDKATSIAAAGDPSDSARGFLLEGDFTWVDNGANCAVEYPVLLHGGWIVEVLGRLWDGQYILRWKDALFEPPVTSLCSPAAYDALTQQARPAAPYGSYFLYETPLSGEISDAQAIVCARGCFSEGAVPDFITGGLLTRQAFSALTPRVLRAVNVQYGDTLLQVQFLDAQGALRTQADLAPESGRLIAWGNNG